MKEAQKKARNPITIVRNKNTSNAANARNKNTNKAKDLADNDNAIKLIEMEVISNALEEVQRRALNMINNTVNRPNPDDTLKILGTATNKDRRLPPLPSGGKSETAEGGAKHQVKPSPNIRTTLSQTYPCLACITAELSEQTNEFLDRMEERKKTMTLAIVGKNLKKKKRKAPDKATIVKTRN